MHVAGIEQRANFEQRSLDRLVRASIEQCRACIGPIEGEHATHCCALSGSVGSEKSRDSARGDLKAELIDRHGFPKTLGEPLDLNHK